MDEVDFSEMLSEENLERLGREIMETDVVYIDSKDYEAVRQYMLDKKLDATFHDRGDYMAVSLVSTTGKSPRRT